MSALSSPVDESTNSLPRFDTNNGQPRPDISRQQTSSIFGTLLAAVFVLIGWISAVSYLALALDYQGQPFVGAIVDRDLVIQDYESFSDEVWPAEEAGLQPGDEFVGALGGVSFEGDNAQEEFYDKLAEKEAGENVVLFVEREGSNPGKPEYIAGTEETCRTVRDTFQRCPVSLGIIEFPFADFMGFFGVGYIVGILILIIGTVVLVRRPDSRPAKFLSATAAGVAVLLMGRFDLMTTHNEVLALLWIFSGCMVGGGVISYSMVFPTNMDIVGRVPLLRYGPEMVGLLLTALTYVTYLDNREFALMLPLVFTLTGVATMIAIMISRRQYTTSPILREQASYILLGSIFILPLFIWVAWVVVSGDAAPGWLTPVVQISALFFVLSAAYATLQYRLLETDRLLPEVMVYALMGAMLLLAYWVVVTSLSLVAVDEIGPDSPFLIAITILLITFGFAPLRNRLRESIDEIFFRRRRRFEAHLEELRTLLTNAINLDDVDNAVRRKLDEALAPNEVILFVRDSEAQVFRAHRNTTTGKILTDVVFPYDQGVTQFLQGEATMLYLEEGKSPPPEVYNDRGRLTLLNVPVLARLKGQRHLSGILAVSKRRSGEAYTYEDLRFIEKAADQTALALERSQIVEDLEHRLVLQDVLSQVSRALNFAIDFETLLELIYAQTIRVIDANIFSISIVDPRQNEVFYAFFVDGDDRREDLEGQRWKLGHGLLSEIIRTQKTLNTNDYVTELKKYDPNAEPENTQIQAWMAVPMTADTARGALGVMSAGTTDAMVRYNKDQLQILSDIANIAASAMEKTRLFEATQERTKQLEALNLVSGRMSYEIEDIDRLLELVTQSATEILQAEAGSLLLVDEATGDLVFKVAVGPSGQELVGMRIERDANSLAAEAVKKSEAIIVNDPMSDTRWHGEVVSDDSDEDDEEVDGFQSRAILTTPLITQGEAIGVLQIINKRDGSSFDEQDSTMLTTFAAQAAVAIQNARLYSRTDEQLNLRVDELNRMAEIDKSLNQSLELSRVAEVTLEWGLKETGAVAAALAITSHDMDSIKLVASKGYLEGSLFYEAAGQEFASNLSIWGRVIRSGKPSFNRNLDQDEAYVETLPGAKVQIIVPMISADRVIGIMLFESPSESALTLVDMGFLERLADSATPAITNAELFNQLQHQQNARAEFVSFIAHELKTPMTSMKGYTDFLIKEIVGPINEQQKEFLNTIYNNMNRLEILVNDLRDVEAMESGHFKLEMGALNFHQVYMESLMPLQQNFERKEQTVIREVPEDLPEVWGDQRRLIQVMTNFLTNANKYTPHGGTVTIQAEVAVNEWDTEGVRRVVHVQITDTGIGISEEDLQRLFKEKYFRTDNAKATDEPGTGLGMVLTRGLILQHGGQVWVESELEKGSTFHFTLPLVEEIIREAT